MVYNISQEFLEANFSYNHVYLNNPQKVKMIHNRELLFFAHVYKHYISFVENQDVKIEKYNQKKIMLTTFRMLEM
jgi:hypothetical protein